MQSSCSSSFGFCMSGDGPIVAVYTGFSCCEHEARTNQVPRQKGSSAGKKLLLTTSATHQTGLSLTGMRKHYYDLAITSSS